MAELMALGFRTVPVTVVGIQAISGYSPTQLAEALQLSDTVAARDPAQTIPLLGKVLDAVQRAVRQMPDDCLDWTAPDRDRPMREFTYHIFVRVHNIIQGLITNVYPIESDSIGRTYSSFKNIADYGGTVIEEYGTWAQAQNLDDLRKPPPVGSDENQRRLINGAERLDLVTGHTIQHLRQLYWVIENFDITPDSRMHDAEFPPEYVLTIISPTGGLF